MNGGRFRVGSLQDVEALQDVYWRCRAQYTILLHLANVGLNILSYLHLANVQRQLPRLKHYPLAYQELSVFLICQGIVFESWKLTLDVCQM